jgi:hypothetical protein
LPVKKEAPKSMETPVAVKPAMTEPVKTPEASEESAPIVILE